ncbi:MAG: hypothetical protein JWQ10_1459 [Herbaspirillum sp.]|nr:hypothetical protein [Herbaspirillum sp.]
MSAMMTPVKTEHTNVVLGAPTGWDEQRDGKCIGLPVHLDPAQGVMYSFWQPTEVDIANILAGVPIRLSVFGRAHPPVAIAVTRSIDG